VVGLRVAVLTPPLIVHTAEVPSPGFGVAALHFTGVGLLVLPSKRVAVSLEALVVRAAIALAVMRLLTVGQRAGTLYHVDLLHRSATPREC
jgi:hypothetical protein